MADHILYDLGVYVFHTEVASYRHSMVAVLDYIGITDLDQLHGRKSGSIQMRLSHSYPALAPAVMPWAELPIEVTLAANTAHNTMYGYLSHAQVVLALDRYAGCHVFQRQE